MAIIASDLHCNVEKVKQFLDYLPEERHIFAGDILDSFTYSPSKAMQSLNLLLESDCELLWGNHDIAYSKLKPFNCSGYRRQDAPMFESIINPNIDRFKIAAIVDGYIITHAGIKPELAKHADIDVECDWLNTYPNGVYDIGQCRGGFHKAGGPLWFDYRYEEISDKYNQVFGHSCSREPYEYLIKTPKGRKHIVCINTPEDDKPLWIFNTTIQELINLNE